VTVPFTGIEVPPAAGALNFAFVCTVTVVPAAKEIEGAKERRRIAAIASTLIPATDAALPLLGTEFSFI